LSQWSSYVAAGLPGLGLAAVPSAGGLGFGGVGGPRPFTASDRADDDDADAWIVTDAPSNMIEL
jgi:hypothetical protein